MSETSQSRLRIGQVCELLREEFPDVSISKLRFLQDKGIVEPERTPGGYRMYSQQDIEALRIALHMQRDQFMPLRVIREELRRRLDERVAGGSSHGNVRPVGTMPQAGSVRLGVEEPYVSAEALVRAAGVSHDLLDACRQADVVTGRRDDDGILRYSPDEVGLMALAGSLSHLGLDVRHLRQAAMAMSRQGALVEQYAATVLRAGGGAEGRAAGIHAVETLTAQLAEFLRIAFVRDVKLMAGRTTGAVHDDAAASRSAAPLL